MEPEGKLGMGGDEPSVHTTKSLPSPYTPEHHFPREEPPSLETPALPKDLHTKQNPSLFFPRMSHSEANRKKSAL